MLGVNRTTKDDGGGGFEFLRIAVDGRDVVYFASPGGRTPTPFRLTSQDKGRAVFENPDHDFPQRLTYEVSAGESLRIRVEAGVGEEVRGFELHLRRVSSWP